jgi:hypothetical protein
VRNDQKKVVIEAAKDKYMDVAVMEATDKSKYG